MNKGRRRVGVGEGGVGEVRVHNASLVTHFKLTPLCYNPYTKHSSMYMYICTPPTQLHTNTPVHIHLHYSNVTNNNVHCRVHNYMKPICIYTDI